MKYESAYRWTDSEVETLSIDAEYLQVNSAGYYEFNEAFHPVNHRKRGRRDYLMVYTCSGKSYVKYNDTEYYIDPGTVFIYKPGEEQCYGQIKNEQSKSYWIHFSGYGVPELLKKLSLDSESMVHIGTDNKISMMMHMIFKAISAKDHNYEIMVTSMLLQLLTGVSGKVYLKQNTGKIDKNSDIINDSLDFIHLNYNKNLTVNQLAHMTGLCANRYINIFREVTGLTPKEYIINTKLEKACELLRHTDLNIRQTAALTGFDDQLYFSRLFKKHKGMNPTEYKKKVP